MGHGTWGWRFRWRPALAGPDAARTSILVACCGNVLEPLSGRDFMRMRTLLASLGLLTCFVLTAAIGWAQTAPDATGIGPHATTSSEYKLPAAVDPDVPGELPTELWARVYRPRNLGAGLHPLLIFLHGNHATCGRPEGIGPGRLDINAQYTFTGTCPDGYVVAPSHEGYAYLAERLASWGYFVVSINANRGVNAAPPVDGDRGLNLRRGRLILRHL